MTLIEIIPMLGSKYDRFKFDSQFIWRITTGPRVVYPEHFTGVAPLCSMAIGKYYESFRESASTSPPTSNITSNNIPEHTSSSNVVEVYSPAKLEPQWSIINFISLEVLCSDEESSKTLSTLRLPSAQGTLVSTKSIRALFPSNDALQTVR